MSLWRHRVAVSIHYRTQTEHGGDVFLFLHETFSCSDGFFDSCAARRASLSTAQYATHLPRWERLRPFWRIWTTAGLSPALPVARRRSTDTAHAATGASARRSSGALCSGPSDQALPANPRRAPRYPTIPEWEWRRTWITSSWTSNLSAQSRSCSRPNL